MTGKRKICFIFVIALLSGGLFISAQAQKPASNPCGEPQTEKWQACKQNGDCALGTDTCGFPIPLNRLYLEEANKYAACMAPTVSCPESRGAKTSGRPFCIEGICGAFK